MRLTRDSLDDRHMRTGSSELTICAIRLWLRPAFASRSASS